ncbi:hypothetical protein JW948_19095 [bacterium]|nr:hypothetical protein [bacterium]
MSLKPEEIQLFKLVIKDLLVGVKNGTLYDFEHPIYVLSIEKLKSTIDEWFKVQKKFILGFSSNRILMNSELIESKDEFLFELARMLHARGILSVELTKGVKVRELAKFVFQLKTDHLGPGAETNVEDWSKELTNITIKELDYRLLLTNQSTEYTTEEEELWAKMFRLDLSLEDGLSRDNIELMIKFFNAPTESASFLNKIYQEARKKQADEQVVKTFHQSVYNICEYFKGKSSPAEQKSFKLNLSKIVSRLHPDLVGQLFETTVINGKDFDLAQELLNDFSDQDVAEFIQSLIRQDGSINEYLLKVFQKMMPTDTSAMNVAPLLTDQLFSKHVMNPQSFKRIQLSIKELFKNHPQNNFLNEMYKITVDALSDESQTTLKYTVRLGPVINQFVKTYEEDFFTSEKIWMVLKTLSGEDDYIDFQKNGDLLMDLFRDVLEKREIALMRNLLMYYMKYIAVKNERGQTPLEKEKNSLFNKMLNESNVKLIVEQIADASEQELGYLTDILMLVKSEAVPFLIDMYLDAKRPANLDKLNQIFDKMKQVVITEAMKRVHKSKSQEVRKLFKIIEICDPEKMMVMARKMVNQKDPALLWDALEHFVPRSKEDGEQMFKLIFKHNNPEIRKKAALAVLKSNSQVLIEELFKRVSGIFAQKKRVQQIVAWSGLSGSVHTYNELKKIFDKRALFSSKSHELIRLNAFNSMAQIDLVKAGRTLQLSGMPKDDPFTRKCETIISKQKNKTKVQ